MIASTEIVENRMRTPRGIRFCFECGAQLRGNHHVVRIYEGHERVFHKDCDPEKLKALEYEQNRPRPEAITSTWRVEDWGGYDDR
jgi:hypothetical protein